MPTLIEDLERIERDLLALRKQRVKPSFEASLKRATDAVEHAHKAFCGSWLGYHSRVYYADMEPPPPGAHFSPEWGFIDAFGHGTVGDWREYDGHAVFEALNSAVGSPSIEDMMEAAQAVADSSAEYREELLSVLDACLARGEDAYLQKMKEQAENARPRMFQQCLGKYEPSGKIFTRDMVAGTNGVQTPPHYRLLAQVDMLNSAFAVPEALARVAKRAALHLSKKERARGIASKQGHKVFIGHGGSAAWRELKDFIEDRLELETDEFNRKPVAGITNITRLSEMLDDAAIAFLVMTAEDEMHDGKMHARQNVIHEAGLFQGRLGFARAIVVLEEGCEQFSNIEGLGQIRFPAKKIKAAFEEVRQVLEREGLL